MNKQEALRFATLLSGCIFLLVCSYPHYLRRVEEHAKHQFILDNHCDTSRPHPSIHYNQMTYDGTQTNCSEARAYTHMPIVLGAFIDLWLRSPIPAILYADNWKVQVSYVLFGCITIVTAIISLRRYYTDCRVVDAVRRQEASLVGERQRLIIKEAGNPRENISDATYTIKH